MTAQRASAAAGRANGAAAPVKTDPAKMSPSANKANVDKNSVSWMSEDKTSSTLRHMEKLHNDYAATQKRNLEKRQKNAEDAARVLQNEKEATRCGSRRDLRASQLDGEAAGERLHANGKTYKERRGVLAEFIGQQEKRELERARKEARPTACHDLGRCSSPIRAAEIKGAACQRLHMDAYRRQLEAQQPSSIEQHFGSPRLERDDKRERLASDPHHLDSLFQDAKDRQGRLEQRQQKAQDDFKKSIEESSRQAMPTRRSPRDVDPKDPKHFEKLHADHQARSERMQKLTERCKEADEKKLAEELALTRSPSPHHPGRDGRRPSSSKDPRSPRFQKELLPEEREKGKPLPRHRGVLSEKEAQPQKAAPTSGNMPVDHLVASVLRGVAARCSPHPNGGDGAPPFSPDFRSLQPHIKAALATYSKAAKQSESLDGYPALCAQPTSLRLFRERLAPAVRAQEWSAQPDPVRQVVSDLDTLMAEAEEAQELLKDLIAPGVMRWEPGTQHAKPEGVPLALFAYDPGIKEESVARAKAIANYGPGESERCYAHLTDLSRLALVFSSCDTLQVGLQHILRRFEVVDVRNHYAAPPSLGARCLEVLVVVKVQGEDGRSRTPFVCELRLEDIVFHRARQQAEPHMETFYSTLRDMYDVAGLRGAHAARLASMLWSRPPVSHTLRVFRRRIAKSYGSTVVAWRKALGGGRFLSYNKFREVCCVLKCQDHCNDLWEELDSARASSISLFEFDPEAVDLLIRFRRSLIKLGAAEHTAEAEKAPEAVVGRFFAFSTSLERFDQCGFRAVVKSFGYTLHEAERLLTYLDAGVGTTCTSATAPIQGGTVLFKDVMWLMGLPQLVDISAVHLVPENYGAIDDDDLTAWSDSYALRLARHGLFDRIGATPPRSAVSWRARSEEPANPVWAWRGGRLPAPRARGNSRTPPSSPLQERFLTATAPARPQCNSAGGRGCSTPEASGLDATSSTVASGRCPAWAADISSSCSGSKASATSSATAPPVPADVCAPGEVAAPPVEALTSLVPRSPPRQHRGLESRGLADDEGLSVNSGSRRRSISEQPARTDPEAMMAARAAVASAIAMADLAASGGEDAEARSNDTVLPSTSCAVGMSLADMEPQDADDTSPGSLVDRGLGDENLDYLEESF